MTNATSVTPSPKPIASTPPYLLDCVDNIEKESQALSELDSWLAKLKGVNMVNVNTLIEQLDEKEEIIMMEGQSDDFTMKLQTTLGLLRKSKLV